MLTAIITATVLLRFVPMLLESAGFRPPASSDAEQFQTVAVRAAFFHRTGIWPYANALGFVYRVFVASQFLGNLLSIAAVFGVVWFIATRTSARTFDSLLPTVALALVATSASSILFTSTTLREAFQMVAVTMFAIGLQTLYSGRGTSLCWFAASIALAAMLHKALLLGLVLSLVTELLVLCRRQLGFVVRRPRLSVGSLIIPPLVVIGIAVASPLSSRFSGFADGASDFQGRTAYVTLDGVSALGRVARQGVGYFLAPLPWQVSQPLDLLVIIENVLRVLVIFGLLRRVLLGNPPNVPLVVGFLRAYLYVEFVWAMGTFAWGTAFRHHLPGMVLLTFACLLTDSRALRPDRPSAALSLRRSVGSMPS